MGGMNQGQLQNFQNYLKRPSPQVLSQQRQNAGMLGQPSGGSYTSYYPNASKATQNAYGRTQTQLAPQLQPGGSTQTQANLTGQGANNGNIQTSITPTTTYSSGQTTAATNQGINAGMKQADLRYQMGLLDRPGVSRSSATVAQALPQVADGRLQAAQAASGIPLLDAFKNATQLLGTQTARENEAQGLGSLALGYGDLQNNQQMAGLNSILALLQQLGGI